MPLPLTHTLSTTTSLPTIPYARCPLRSLQVVNVLGFKLPFYKSATLLLSLGLSLRVLYYLFKQRPQVIHVSTPGIMCFAAVLYARLLAVPLVMSYHTHIPEYIPRYTWSGLVQPMWSIIRWCTRRADLTLVTSKAMKVRNRRMCWASGCIKWLGAQHAGWLVLSIAAQG
jgi:sulfoquinovosyltransferase